MGNLIRIQLVALLLVAAGGCSSSSTYPAMTIAVRDKLTHEPVAGALVYARPVHFYAPGEVPLFGRDAILDPNPPKPSRGITGDDGTVRLEVIIRHPVQFVVIAAGYEPQVVDLAMHPAAGGASEWLDADPGPAVPEQTPRVEVRFLE